MDDCIVSPPAGKCVSWNRDRVVIPKRPGANLGGGGVCLFVCLFTPCPPLFGLPRLVLPFLVAFLLVPVRLA